MFFLQVATSSRMHLEVADVKNAFCQGREMRRKGGRLYVEPCDGLGLELWRKLHAEWEGAATAVIDAVTLQG